MKVLNLLKEGKYIVLKKGDQNYITSRLYVRFTILKVQNEISPVG